MNLEEVCWIRGEWDSRPEEPFILHSALNGERFEVRKLEQFRDGRVGFAGEFARTASTWLGTEAVPSIDEINGSSELEAASISRAEFDEAWISAIRAAADGDELFRCRCCGVRGLQEPALGTYEICSSCGWEDDPEQSRKPTYEGGANRSSLLSQRQEHLEHLLQQQYWDLGEVHESPPACFVLGGEVVSLPEVMDQIENWLRFGDSIEYAVTQRDGKAAVAISSDWSWVQRQRQV